MHIIQYTVHNINRINQSINDFNGIAAYMLD